MVKELLSLTMLMVECSSGAHEERKKKKVNAANGREIGSQTQVVLSSLLRPLAYLAISLYGVLLLKLQNIKSEWGHAGMQLISSYTVPVL